MKKTAITLSLIFVAFFLVAQNLETEKIVIGPGPEDFVLDDNNLIISCAERREEDESANGIYTLNLDDNSKNKFEIVFKTERKFHPHGISIVKHESKKYLFVVNHITPKNAEIICFEINENKLIEVNAIQDKLIKHPNSVVGISPEEFYFTNDLLVTGSVGHYQNGEFKLIAKELNYANGLLMHQNILYVTATMGNKLIKLVPNKGKFKKEKIDKQKGPDNIRAFDKNHLLVAGHTNILKFVGHTKNKEKISPFVIYKTNLKTQASEIFFEDDGSILSGASTAIVYKNNLYIAQVFENFILKVELK